MNKLITYEGGKPRAKWRHHHGGWFLAVGTPEKLIDALIAKAYRN